MVFEGVDAGGGGRVIRITDNKDNWWYTTNVCSAFCPAPFCLFWLSGTHSYHTVNLHSPGLKPTNLM